MTVDSVSAAPTARRRTPRWLPLAVAVVAAVVIGLAAPRSRFYLFVSPAVPVLVLGVLGTGGLLAADTVGRRRSGRVAADVAAARSGAERERRRFVARLDHELKNPLTALLAALAEPAPGVPVEPAALRTARDQADRVRRLLTDLRRVADVETTPLDLGPVDVAAVLSEAVGLVTADSGRPVRLALPTAPRPLPTVRGDADLLVVAVHNVVANAVKHTRPGDVVEVRAREAPGPPAQVVVEVADTGPGVPPDEVDLVWEELARGRGAAGTPGSGIGLALVRVVVSRHGGTARLDSRVGAGTAVTLSLPVAGPSPDPGTMEAWPPPSPTDRSSPTSSAG